MKLALFVLGLALAAPAAPAVAKHKHLDYAAYAGDPVRQIRFTHLYNWQRTGDKSMVVWTKPSTAYLLTLAHRCDALDGRFTIGLGGIDGVPGHLEAGMGNVIIGPLRCPVTRIQPLDLVAMKLAKS